jgi:hypothetical protein
MAKEKAKPAKKPIKGGRPTDYSLEIATLICDRVATNSCGLEKLCARYPELPVPSTIYLWRLKHPVFSEMYAKAKMIQADILAEQCLEIADDDSNDTKINPETGEEVANTEFIARSRLRIDTRKWLAAKLLPKQYGKPAEEVQKNIEDKKALVTELLDRLID